MDLGIGRRTLESEERGIVDPVQVLPVHLPQVPEQQGRVGTEYPGLVADPVRLLVPVQPESAYPQRSERMRVTKKQVLPRITIILPCVPGFREPLSVYDPSRQIAVRPGRPQPHEPAVVSQVGARIERGLLDDLVAQAVANDEPAEVIAVDAIGLYLEPDAQGGGG